MLPFVAFLGGLAQFLAGMWAYQAGDGLATAMLGTWGAFWMGYAALNALFASGKLTEPRGSFVELSFWFVLAAITWIGAVAATSESGALAAVFVLFAAGSTLAAIADGVNDAWVTILAGWVFGSGCAWYTATAMLFEQAFDREVLPVCKLSPAEMAVRGRLKQAPAARRAS